MPYFFGFRVDLRECGVVDNRMKVSPNRDLHFFTGWVDASINNSFAGRKRLLID